MDPLADILTAFRFSSWVVCRTAIAAGSGLGMSAASGPMFHFVLRGEPWLVTASGRVALQTGDVVLATAGQAHDVEAGVDVDVQPLASLMGQLAAEPAGARTLRIGAEPRPVELVCGAFFFDRELWDPLLGFLPPLLRLPRSAYDESLLGATLSAAARELDQPGPASDLVLAKLGDVCLLEIMRATVRANATRSDRAHWLRASRDPEIWAALRAIHAEPGRAWTVDELAAVAGCARSTFTARFRAAVGTSALQYLTRWRVIRATAYLEETNKSVAEVATAVGYANEASFTKVFKALTGVPPGHYREVCKARRSPAL